MTAPKSPMTSPAAPRVSMILPVHNGADYLADAIASVVEQSFPDFELICVDDASSDGSGEILSAAAAADFRIRLIRLEQNVGLPAALNRGFAAARGAYLSWTSDDNLLRATMLERLVGALDANPQCAIVHADYSVIDPAGQIVGFVSTKGQGGLLMGNHVGASFLYRREVDFALGGYDTTLFGAEDFDFWLRASAHFEFVHCPEDLYLYRKHPRSLTNSRAAAVQTLNTDVVLRAIPASISRKDRAAVMLALYRRNFVRLRLDLLLQGFLSAPITATLQLPSLGWHALRIMRARLRG